MNQAVLVLIILTLFFSSTYSSESSWKDLVSNHLLLSGGEQNLKTMKSISRRGSIKFFNFHKRKGKVFSYSTDIDYDSKKLREELKSSNLTLVDRGTDGHAFWEWDNHEYKFINNNTKKENMLETVLKANRDLLWIESDLSSINKTKEQSWSPNSSCIVGLKKSKNYFLCFSKRTKLLQAKGNDLEYRIVKDWQKVGNIYIPFKIEHYRNNKKVYVINLLTAKVNKVIPDARFRIPSN